MGENGARDNITKRRRGKERVEQGRGSRGPQLYFDKLFAVAPEFLVTPLLMEPICLIIARACLNSQCVPDYLYAMCCNCFHNTYRNKM